MVVQSGVLVYLAEVTAYALNSEFARRPANTTDYTLLTAVVDLYPA